MENQLLVSRRYPLEIPPEKRTDINRNSRRSWLREDGFAIRAARFTASALLEVLDWRRDHRDLSQTISTLLLLIFGLSLTGSAGLIDEYLHRGVETGVERPYVVQPAGKEMATNVNLLPYSGEGLVDLVDAIDASGFRYVRQQFSWAGMESIKGERDFSRYEEMVVQFQRRKIQVIAVIVDAPDWAMINDPTSPDPRTIVDPEALGSFLQELTGHFPKSVGYVQIWNQPNLDSATVDGAIPPVDFVRLLAAASSGAYTGNSAVKILLPELGVESASSIPGDDLEYLGALYEAGAAPFFDIVAIPLDGTVFSPDDRQVGRSRLNMSRAVLFRELMQDNNDSESPIWATSFGWASGPELSRETQAEFVTRGLERSWAEWPWMGLLVQWQFFADAGSPNAPYSIVLPNGSPTPLYQQLIADRVRAESKVAHTGFAPMESASVSYQGNWKDQHLEGRIFKTSSQVGSSVAFTFSGTGAVAFMRSGPEVGLFRVELDGAIVPGDAEADSTLWDFSWYDTSDIPLKLLSGLDDTTHTVTITLATEGEMTLGGMVVSRDAPFTWPIMLMAVAAFISLFLAMRSLIYLVAIRAGHLVRKGTTRNPELPTMPNWRPTRRV